MSTSTTTDLSDAEFAELDELLATTPEPLQALDASMLDGYLCGVIVQPRLIDVDEWLPNIFDYDGGVLPEDVDPAWLARIKTLVERRHGALNRAMVEDGWFDPVVLDLDENEEPAPAEMIEGEDEEQAQARASYDAMSIISRTLMPWVAGFQHACLCFPDLADMPDDAVMAAMARLYRHLPAETDEEKEIVATLDREHPLKDLDEAIEELVVTVADLCDLTEAQRYAVETIRREGPKLGRNDPCHCGSGRKYKSSATAPTELKLQLLSDLHLETEAFDPEPAPGAELLVLAGDVDSNWHGLRRFKDWPVPVLFVPGNHEYDRRDFDQARADLRALSAELGFIHLDDASTIRSDAQGRRVRFLGSTRWSDFDLFGPSGRERAMRAAGYFQRVMAAMRHGQPFGAEAVREEAQRCRAWLAQDLTLGEHGPDWDATVVITHFAPSIRSADPRYGGQPGTASFCNNDEALLPGARLWLHGHLHCQHDYRLGSTRVICNARGHAKKAKPPDAGRFA